ncbi:MAG: hypothetical protein AB7V46_08930 [Thermomicrobiales bacterium]
MLALLCLLLAACADDSSDRQFAGDDRLTSVPTLTTPPFSTEPSVATPVAIESPLAEEELFAVRGDDRLAAFISNDHIFLVEADAEHPSQLVIDSRWKPWLVSVSPSGDEIAALVSLASSSGVWKVLILDRSGAVLGEHRVVGDDASPVVAPDIVTTGSGGLDWSPDGERLAVALPTGGIYRISMDGELEEMAAPRRVPRPGDLAWSTNGQAIAFTAQPDRRSGFGVFVASSAALPLDPITVLRPDPTGNRSARDIAWTANDDHILVILDRRETGGAGGDVMEVPATGGAPVVVWSSGLQIVDGGAQTISLSPDGEVLAMLSTTNDGSALLILRQFEGPAEARRELGASIGEADVVWTSVGVLIGGSGQWNETGQEFPFAVLIDPQGEIDVIQVVATPEAAGTPAAASPVAVESTPSAAASPGASPRAASPVASPAAATPEASPVRE